MHTLLALALATQVCVGNCDDTDGITIGDLVTAVGVVMGTQPPTACPSIACGETPIACLVQAINNTLLGCHEDPPDRPSLLVPPKINSNPFASDLTISFEDADAGVFTLNGYHPSKAMLTAPVVVGTVAPPPDGAPPPPPEINPECEGVDFVDDGESQAAIAAATTSGAEYVQRTACNDFSLTNCVMPPPVANRTDVFRVQFGLQVEQLDEWEWRDANGQPITGFAKIALMLPHIRELYQTIAAVALRDLGVKLEIRHINFRKKQTFDLADYKNMSEPDGVWPAIDCQGACPHYVQRLFKNWAGYANTTYRCPQNRYIASRAFMRFDLPAATSAGARDSMLSVVNQELFHQLFALAHAQCYVRQPCTDFEPGGDCSFLATCSENHEYCYHSPVGMCPEKNDRSLMDYCSYCFPLNDYPYLRIGSFTGPSNGWGEMRNLVRNNILARRAENNDGLATCDWPKIGTMPPMSTDSDMDSFPNTIDNCPLDKNHAQVDADFDGKGDKCDSCAVQPGNGRGAWLLLPLLVLVRRRR